MIRRGVSLVELIVVGIITAGIAGATVTSRVRQDSSRCPRYVTL